MRAARFGLAALTVLCAASPAFAQTVAIVAATAADEPVVEHLRQQFEGDVRWRASVYPREPESLLAESQSWPEDLVVVVDSEAAVVRVLRKADGTILSRRLDPQTAIAPYAVALAGVELLELAGHTPPDSAQPPREAPAPEAPPPEAPTPVAPGRPVSSGPEVHAALAAGGAFTLSVDGDVGLLQPIVGADVLFAWRTGLRATVGVRGAAFGQRDRALTPVEGLSDAKVRYDRNEIGLRLSLGYRDGRSIAAGYMEGGPAFVRVEGLGSLSGELDDVSGSVTRTRAWIGFGGELRYRLGAGVSLGALFGFVVYPQATLYTAGGTTAFDEGNGHLRAQAVLVWESDGPTP